MRPRTLRDILQNLVDREIGFQIESIPIVQFDLMIGDPMNGYIAKGHVETAAEIAGWFQENEPLTPNIPPGQ